MFPILLQLGDPYLSQSFRYSLEWLGWQGTPLRSVRRRLLIVLLFSAGQWQQLHPSTRAPSFPSLSFDQVPLGQVPGHLLLYPLGEVPGHLHSWPPLSLPTIEGPSRCLWCFLQGCGCVPYSVLWIRIQHFQNVLYSDSDPDPVLGLRIMSLWVWMLQKIWKIVFIFS